MIYEWQLSVQRLCLVCLQNMCVSMHVCRQSDESFVKWNKVWILTRWEGRKKRLSEERRCKEMKQHRPRQQRNDGDVREKKTDRWPHWTERQEVGGGGGWGICSEKALKGKMWTVLQYKSCGNEWTCRESAGHLSHKRKRGFTNRLGGCSYVIVLWQIENYSHTVDTLHRK